MNCTDIDILEELGPNAADWLLLMVLALSEHKAGKWQITDAYPHNVYCSVCHKRFAQTHWAVWQDGSLPREYCPNCGAKMEGCNE